MSKEAMKLALMALEKLDRVMKRSPDTDKAITALKQALEQPEPEPVAWTDEDFTELIVSEDIAKDIGATVPLYTAPPKREPPCKTGSQCTTECMECAEPEPVAWVERDGELVWNNREAAIGRNLYASPPKREPEPVIDKSAAIRIATSLGWTPQRKPLTPQSPCEMTQAEYKMFKLGWLECEAAHGIKEQS